MNETRYMISEAAKQVCVEAHVLRYWEEELKLPVARNELGQRYYTENDIKNFKKIKEMKDNGFQLKAIRMVLNSKNGFQGAEVETAVEVKESGDGKGSQRSADNAARLTFLLKKMLLEVLQENNKSLLRSVEDTMGERVIKEMNYLFREQEEREDERFRQFDESVRKRQKKKKQPSPAGRKKLFFSKKKSLP